MKMAELTKRSRFTSESTSGNRCEFQIKSPSILYSCWMIIMYNLCFVQKCKFMLIVILFSSVLVKVKRMGHPHTVLSISQLLFPPNLPLAVLTFRCDKLRKRMILQQSHWECHSEKCYYLYTVQPIRNS